MNPERKNVIEYDGNMILCQHCINHPKCIIMKENNNFKWATELACPICKNPSLYVDCVSLQLDIR